MTARNREIIKLDIEADRDFIRYGEKHDLYNWVDEKQNYVDLSKGYRVLTVFIQRKSDGKFFKGEYEDMGQHGDEIYADFVEVFPVAKTVTDYE